MTEKKHPSHSAWQLAIRFFENNFHLEQELLKKNQDFLALDYQTKAVVEKLFLNKKSDHTILDQPATDKYRVVMEQNLAGELIGSYQLIDLMAHGGMSSVYRARVIDIQTQKDVAIKLIPINLQTDETTSLFRQEMHTLSQLHHPNIISMHHGDVSASGIPYLVMELVENANQIDDYLFASHSKYPIKHKQDIRATVEQFITLCHVINYAHQNGVIHQDIKPSNVLIDPHGHLLVLDFGVAAFTETLPNHHAYTLSYAPPEQTQEKQHPAPSLDTYAIASLLIRCLSKAPDDSAGWQQHTLESLSIDNDLLFILNKGISSKEKRYQSCSDLALDLQLWLKNMPINELKNKPLYRFKKTLSRHPLSAVLACFTLLTMTTGLVFYHQQYQLAVLESQKAQQVKNILIDAIDQNDPDISKGNEFTVRDMLSQAQLSIKENQVNDANTAKELMMTLGSAFNKLGDYDLAIENIENALSIEGDNIEALLELATLKLKQKHAHEAKLTLDQIDSLIFNADQKEQIKFHLLLAKYYIINTDFALADIQFNLAENISKLVNNPVTTIDYLAALAAGKFEQDDIDNSIKAITQAVKLSETHHGILHSKTLQMKSVAAETYLSSSSEDVLTVIAMYEKLIPQQKELLGEDHPAVAKSLFLKSTAHRSMNQTVQARVHAKQALIIAEQQFGSKHIFTGKILMSLGAVYLAEGDTQKAIEYASNAVEIYESHFGPEHHETLQYKTSYISILGKDNQHKKALELLLQIRPIQLSKLGPTHRATLFVDVILSRTYLALGDLNQAVSVGERCLQNAKKHIQRNIMEVYCAFVLENAYFESKNYFAAAALIEIYIDDPLINSQPKIIQQFNEHQSFIKQLADNP